MAIEDDGAENSRLVTTTVDTDESVPMAMLRAVAAVDDKPIEELPLLYETIDPDALGELVDDERFDGIVTFDYDSYVVLIDGDRRIEVCDGDDAVS